MIHYEYFAFKANPERYFRVDETGSKFHILINNQWETRDQLVSCYYFSFHTYFEITDRQLIAKLASYPFSYDEIIRRVHERLIKRVLEGIEKQYAEAVSAAFREHLYSVYKKERLTLTDPERAIDFIIRSESSLWLKDSAEEKLLMSVRDDAFETVRRISLTGYQLARRKLAQHLDAVISKEEAAQSIDTMIRESKNVMYFNSSAAKRLVSEGILDYHYASRHVDITSLRLSHDIRRESR